MYETAMFTLRWKLMEIRSRINKSEAEMVRLQREQLKDVIYAEDLRQAISALGADPDEEWDTSLAA